MKRSSPGGRGSAVRTGIFYSGSHFLAALLNSVSAFAVRLWVPATTFGGAAIVTATAEYFRAYDALYRNAVDREVPVHLARGDAEGAEHVLQGAYTLMVGSLLVESAIMVGAGLLAHDPVLRMAWWVYALVNLFDGVNQADRITLKATQRFTAHNRALVVGGAVGGASLILLSWAFGSPGYFAGVASNAAILFALYRREMGGARIRLSLKGLPRGVLRRILTLGSLVAGLKIAQQLLLTADRWLVVGFLGIRELGYYSLGTALAARLYLLPQTLVGSYSPRLNGMLGNGRLEEARAAVAKLQTTTALVSACTCGVAALGLDPLVGWFLPEYRPAVPAFQLMLLGAYFLAMNATSLQVHVGLDRVARAIAPAALGVAVTVGLGWGAVRYGLIGVAAARVAGLATYTLLLDASTRHLLRVRGMVRAVLEAGAALGVLLALDAFVGLGAASVWLGLYGAYSVRRLSTLYGVAWRDLPRVLRPAREAPAVSGEG